MWITREEQYRLIAQSYSVKSIAFKLAPTLAWINFKERTKCLALHSLLSLFLKSILFWDFSLIRSIWFFKKSLDSSTHFELFYLQLCGAGLFSFFSQEQFLGLTAVLKSRTKFLLSWKGKRSSFGRTWFMSAGCASLFWSFGSVNQTLAVTCCLRSGMFPVPGAPWLGLCLWGIVKKSWCCFRGNWFYICSFRIDFLISGCNKTTCGF